MKKTFLYAEFQVSIPFDQIDWQTINVEMKKYVGIITKQNRGIDQKGTADQWKDGCYIHPQEETSQQERDQRAN